MTSNIAAQVIVCIDSNGQFHAEIGTDGTGMRRKLDLRDGLWEPMLRGELRNTAFLTKAAREEHDRIMGQRKHEKDLRWAESMARKRGETQRQIYDNVLVNHGRRLANKVVPGLTKRGTKLAGGKGIAADLDLDV